MQLAPNQRDECQCLILMLKRHSFQNALHVYPPSTTVVIKLYPNAAEPKVGTKNSYQVHPEHHNQALRPLP
jgi:hypothetical protein